MRMPVTVVDCFQHLLHWRSRPGPRLVESSVSIQRSLQNEQCAITSFLMWLTDSRNSFCRFFMLGCSWSLKLGFTPFTMSCIVSSRSASWTSWRERAAGVSSCRLSSSLVNWENCNSLESLKFNSIESTEWSSSDKEWVSLELFKGLIFDSEPLQNWK